MTLVQGIVDEVFKIQPTEQIARERIRPIPCCCDIREHLFIFILLLGDSKVVPLELNLELV